jgi:hypothetical protein
VTENEREADGKTPHARLTRDLQEDRLLDGECATLVLAGDSPEAFNDIENPNRVAPQKTTLTFIKGAVNLPPHSLTLLKFPPK